MKKITASPIRFKFSVDSPAVIELGIADSNQFPRSPDGKSVIIEFQSDDLNETKINVDRYQGFLEKNRSKAHADALLDSLAFALRNEFEIPFRHRLLLSKALSRVIERDESATFLYGRQESSGRPKKDIEYRFKVFVLVESARGAIGRLSTSRKGEGAYEFVKRILQNDGIYWEVDEIRRVHQSVRTEASDDPEFLHALIEATVSMGFRLTSPPKR